MNDVNEMMRSEVSRRKFLAGVGVAGVGTAAVTLLGGCGSPNRTVNVPTPTPTPTPNPLPTPYLGKVTDFDILNFALNLEYLEAEYYLRAATGQGLSATDAGSGAGTVVGGRQVTFQTEAFRQYAVEIANDEQNHVRFLRSAISAFGGTPVSRPNIDLTNSFNAAAKAANIGPAFDPFANEQNFIVGSFTFEDVGVSAYHGAAGLIQDPRILTAAAGILATEAYHSGEIRTILAALGGAPLAAANAIVDLRAAAGGGNETHVAGNAIVAADSNSVAYSRTTAQVLRIVYLQATGLANGGGFFPNGLNGRIAATN